MKKICAILLVVSMAVYPLHIRTAYAVEELPQIVVGNEETLTGESVVVPISLVNNSGIIGASFSVNYDTSKLRLVEAVDEKLLGNATFTTNEIENMPFRIMFDDSCTENYTEDGVLVSLHFEVLENAESGFTPVEVTVNEDSFVDANVEYVGFDAVSGGVKISENTTTATTTTEPTTTTTETTTIPDTQEYTLGDVNEDGFVDATDASLVLSEYAILSTGGSETFSDIQKSAGDVNFDGFVDATDASEILSFYAYLSTGGIETDMNKWRLLPNEN